MNFFSTAAHSESTHQNPSFSLMEKKNFDWLIFLCIMRYAKARAILTLLLTM